MMKEKAIPTKVKGTVLYTVVTVMMILIVFLMGTLALAATANNRAMNSYTSAQTQATARAAVEAVLASMQNDKSVASAVANVSATNKLLTIDSITFEDAAYLGRVTDARVEYVGEKWQVNSDKKLEATTVIKISATVEQGRESSTVAVYVLKNVDPPEPSDGGAAGFVSTGNIRADNGTSAFGGTYVGFNDTKTPADFNIQNPVVFETDVQINGNMVPGNSLSLVIKGPGTGMTIWGDLVLGNKAFEILSTNATSAKFNDGNYSYKDIPYIYVDGEIRESSDADKGLDTTVEVPLNIFCSSINVSNFRTTADVYCFTPGVTSYIKGGSSELYRWTAKVIESGQTAKSTHYGGGFYTKGSLELEKGCTFGGDVVVEQDFTYREDVLIVGDLSVGGTIKLDNPNSKKLTVTGKIYYDGPLPAGVVSGGGAGLTYEPGYSYTIDGFGDPVSVTATTVAQFEDLNWDGTPTGNYHYSWVRDDGQELSRIWADTVTEVSPGEYVDNWGNKQWPPTYQKWVNSITGQVVYSENDTKVTVASRWVNADGDEVPAPDSANVDSYSNGKHYPKEYEKEVILGQKDLAGNTITDPKDAKATKIVTTYDEVMASAVNPYNTEYVVPGTAVDANGLPTGGAPDANSYAATVESSVYTLSGGADNTYYTVSGNDSAITRTGNTALTIVDSCTIKGSSYGTVFTIKPGGDPTNAKDIWIKLDNYSSSQAQFILDDVNYPGVKVNFLIVGNVKFDATKSFPIITQSLLNILSSNQTFQIFTDSAYALTEKNADGTIKKDDDGNPIYTYPVITEIPINIYSTKTGSDKLEISNSALIAANIMAPYLTLEYHSNVYDYPGVYYYNGYKASDPAKKKIGCIGCCVIKDFSTNSKTDDFNLLYVTKSQVSNPPENLDDALMTSWGILYYENY